MPKFSLKYRYNHKDNHNSDREYDIEGYLANQQVRESKANMA